MMAKNAGFFNRLDRFGATRQIGGTCNINWNFHMAEDAGAWVTVRLQNAGISEPQVAQWPLLRPAKIVADMIPTLWMSPPGS